MSKYAKCKDCNKPMEIGNGCTETEIKIGGKTYARIKLGDEGDDWGETCHDCNVKAGQYHHFGCDVERCPVCSEQLISCDCDKL